MKTQFTKKLIALLAVVLIVTSSFASDGNKKINYWILNQFQSAYTKATDVNWKVADDFIKASFLLNGQKTEAFYSNEGTFIGESKPVAIQDMPQAAIKTLITRYKGNTVKEVIEFSTPQSKEFYISLENDYQVQVLKIKATGEVLVYKNTIK